MVNGEKSEGCEPFDSAQGPPFDTLWAGQSKGGVISDEGGQGYTCSLFYLVPGIRIRPGASCCYKQCRESAFSLPHHYK